MPTNLAIDDDLIKEALKLGGHRTKREAVNEALRSYIQYLKRVESLKHMGTFDFDPDWDYKRARRMR